MKPPVVFISYSHDSDTHKEWVLRLATDLRAKGVDATCDQWDLSPGQDVAAFMHDHITKSDRVLLVCTETYVSKAEQGTGGVGYERLILTAELVQNIDTKKFIPLVRDNLRGNKVPLFLGPRLYIDFSSNEEYPIKLNELLCELLGEPSKAKPPLGPNPFSGAVPTPSPARAIGPTGLTAQGRPLLESEWFQAQSSVARLGVSRLKLNAFMELRIGLHEGLNKSQIELLNAVRSSEIHTFGWPIAVTLENREEYKPRPYEDGIRAEIAINEKRFSGEPSYDYWAIRNTGDFYLLQSLFEDSRAEEKIFFNTRIVRVTEALLFAANLYSNLGISPETRLSIGIGHYGLANRQLASSNSSRYLFPKVSKENQSQSSVTVVLGEIRNGLVENVKRILSPLFLLFDFQEFSDAIYQDIVRRFEKGEVS